MKIAIDASNLARKERTGIAVYGCNLIEQFARLGGDRRFVLCYRLSRMKHRRFFFRVSDPRFRSKIIQEPLHPLFMRGIDLFHGLDARLYGPGKTKQVVTVHDLYRFTGTRRTALDASTSLHGYETMLTNAAGIIAVSEHTRKEVLRCFPSVRCERVHTVHHGVEERFSPRAPERVATVLQRYGIRNPYLLHVGCLESRKNLLRILEAFVRVRSQREEPVELVLSGPEGEGAETIRQALRTLPPGCTVRRTGFVPREDLPALYTGAEVFLYPSLHEGFGLPVLEAMACGTPVVTSRVTSLPEVAGDAALLVDPYRTGDLADAVLHLLRSPAKRRVFGHRGRRRAAAFTWARTARQTLAVYEHTVSKGREGGG